ncbi:MAG: 6-carboxytetrahydropterin synthase [Holophagales bacterium]|jgi:6-pyruvoyl-tetrahydropterin synthase|nr:6-carboxytetrahydropterin synthase [Holophagales bacterium]
MNDVLITEYRKFAADHYHSLPGFCEPRHGHNWELEASVRIDNVSLRPEYKNKSEFSNKSRLHDGCKRALSAVKQTSQAQINLSSTLDTWVAIMDRSLLNEQNILAGRNPTAEVLAECLFQFLETSGLCPVIVRIKEKSHYWAICMKC